jgi:hypothetical protein
MGISISVKTGNDVVMAAFEENKKQATYALMKSLNKTAAQARSNVQVAMPAIFDRPTPWVINSLRINWAYRDKLRATIAFEDHKGFDQESTMLFPQVEGGTRAVKPMESRLIRAGYLKVGWKVIPGRHAPLDAYGNMMPSEISRILNLLRTYGEAGYNKADYRTEQRLKKGNPTLKSYKKKIQYGFQYFVVKVGEKTRGKQLRPGIYRRTRTNFARSENSLKMGTSIDCMMLFISRATYRKRLDFYGIAEKAVVDTFDDYFTQEFKTAMATSGTSGYQLSSEAYKNALSKRGL